MWWWLLLLFRLLSCHACDCSVETDRPCSSLQEQCRVTALSIANVSRGACTEDGAASVDDVPMFVVNASAPVNVSDVVAAACFRPDLTRPSRFACEADSDATVVLFGIVPLGSESCPSAVHLHEPNASVAKLLWAGKSGNATLYATIVAGAFQCINRGEIVFEVATAAPCCADDCAPWERRAAAPTRVDVLGAVLGASVAALCCVVLAVWLLRRRRPPQHEKA